MEIVIPFFFLTLALLVVLPTLPNSRGLRAALAAMAIPGIICAYWGLEMFATSGRYSGELDAFIKKSEHLLSQGKSEEVRAVLANYLKDRRDLNPPNTALSSRASLLYDLIKQKEMGMASPAGK